MSGERLARASLALDAVYCAFIGLAAIVFRRRISGLVGIPGPAVGALGAAVIGWAYVVLGQTVRIDWRRGVKQMMTANTIVASLLTLASALHPGRGASALMAFVSLDLISIAAVQAVALTRDWSERRRAADASRAHIEGRER